MWGTQKPQGTYPSKRRFISTCCGKNDYFRAVATVLRSPSPRVWGTRYSSGHYYDLVGLIPTYAGNTCLARPAVPMSGAHPHVCGEHNEFCANPAAGSGSSPRMRGTRGKYFLSRVLLGLIPTYAGNTSGQRCKAPAARAHPHVCGEHLAPPAPPRALSGSSPRMRGTRTLQGVPGGGYGLIPTYAGNTAPAVGLYPRRWAHPHVCGEHFQQVGVPRY